MKQLTFHGTWRFWLLSLAISLFQTAALAVTTSEFSVLHSFGKPNINPNSLILDTAGNLYGVDKPGVFGGGFGSIFKLDAAGNPTTVYTFDGENGSVDTITLGGDGNFYGQTNNTVPFDPLTNPYGNVSNSVIFQLNLSGAQPVFKPLLKINGFVSEIFIDQNSNVYFADGNQILQIDPSSNTQTKVVFQSADAGDSVRLQGIKGNVLYGVTTNINSPTQETNLFEIDPAIAGSYKVIASKSGNQGFGDLLLGKDGKFYSLYFRGSPEGFGEYDIVQFDTSTQPASEKLIFTNNSLGPRPSLWLEGKPGVFYISSRGIDKLDITGVTPSFTNVSTSGADSVVISNDGNALFATYAAGGSFNAGYIAKIDVSGAEPVTSVLYAVKQREAYDPNRVFQALDGNLYGTAIQGGKFGKGALFRVDISGQNPVYTEVFGFGEPGAASLSAPENFVQAKDGKFYGTTSAGGSQNVGGMYRLDISGQSPLYTELLNFGEANAPVFSPHQLFVGNDGNLYGTFNPRNDAGDTVFKIDISGENAIYSSLYQAGCASCTLGVIQTDNGNLYGSLTKVDDATGAITGLSLFQVNLSDAEPLVQVFHEFPLGEIGSVRLLRGRDGKLYGTTQGAGSQALFEIDITGTMPFLKPSKEFIAPLPPFFLEQTIQAADGNFYGTTVDQGSFNLGTLFQLDMNAATQLSEPVTLHSFDSDSLSPTYSPTLIEGKDGALYGITGKQLYQFDITAPVPVFSALYDLQKELSLPSSQTLESEFTDKNSFFQGNDGNLYGFTKLSGAYHSGALFRVKLSEPPANTPPVAINDSYRLVYPKKGKSNSITVAAPGVLNNDTDAERDALTVSGATASSPRVIQLPNKGGKVTLYADGHFVYAPPKNIRFFGTRSFTYQVNDGKVAGNTATVTLTLKRK